MNTATVTSLESSSTTTTSSSLRNKHNGTSNGNSNPKAAVKPTTPDTNRTTDELRRAIQKKYRHVAAVHSKSRPSTLSHDSNTAPSFIGFRNLMIIVLSTSSRCRSCFNGIG